MRPPSSVSRRAWLMGAGAVVAWASSPARALMAQMDGSAAASTDLNALIARMTVEEKAGQVTLMAAAWAGGAANALNPTSPSRASFRQQMDDVRRGHVGGVFNGNGAEMARQMQTMAVEMPSRMGMMPSLLMRAIMASAGPWPRGSLKAMYNRPMKRPPPVRATRMCHLGTSVKEPCL